jgi:polyhydroxybutyrate depolymerase
MKNSFIAILLTFFLEGCSGQTNPISQTIGDSIRRTIEINGVNRAYLLFSPDNLKNDAPLVFVLHGYGGSPEGINNYSKINAIASKNGFAVCYPEALEGADRSRSWNVGYSNFGVNDIEFISELASFLQETHQLSVKNTFCTGMSNGGDMTFQMVYFQPELFRAVATIAGTLMTWIPDSIKLEKVTPFLMMNGTNDKITQWEGDENYPVIGPNGYLGARETANSFIDLNECMEIQKDTLPDISKTDGSFVVREKSVNCTNNNQIWLYTVINGGHAWPGSWGNMDINASEELWLFFEQFID